MKKNLMVNVVPVLIELKRMLEEGQSPLLGYVMECVRALLKDYKSEVEDILVADKQLAKEILHGRAGQAPHPKPPRGSDCMRAE